MIEPVAFEAVDEDLCRAVIDGRITPKRFDSLPEGTWQVEGWTLDQDRRPGTALIDIDNDGKLDNIASLKAEDGRRLELASIGISPPALPADPTNELLGQLQYELPGQGPICQVKPFASGCRAFDFWRFDPFQYNDRTYIDKYHANDYGKSDRSIVELANGKVRRMCRLGYRIPGWRAAAVQRTPEK
jgi:hypothetical protein